MAGVTPNGVTANNLSHFALILPFFTQVLAIFVVNNTTAFIVFI